MNKMRKNIFLAGMLIIVLVSGVTVISCDSSSSGGGGGISPFIGGSDGTLYDPEGTWDIIINGQKMTVIVSDNSWVFKTPGGYYDDSGTYTLKGNVATLYSFEWKANIGTVTITSETTMTVRLVSPSLIRGTFTGTKR